MRIKIKYLWLMKLSIKKIINLNKLLGKNHFLILINPNKLSFKGNLHIRNSILLKKIAI
jgi:hypothetical protein